MNILESLGLNIPFEELTEDERKSYMDWMKVLKGQPVTLEQIKDFVTKLRLAVDSELASEKLNPKQDLFIKARLKCYITLEAFLNGPEQAKKAMESYIKHKQV